MFGASRTDAGVHAKGQVAFFDTSTKIAALNFLSGMNSHLPDSIAVIAVEETDEDFHARFNSIGKRYLYQILCAPQRSPILHNRVWHCPQPLDLQAMRHAADGFIGEHDFSSFRSAACGAHTTIRNISEVSLDKIDDTLAITVIGNAFLQNMVRILAGTLVDVGLGRISSDDISSIIKSRDRTRAGRTAPAAGLYLEEVYYPRSTKS